MRKRSLVGDRVGALLPRLIFGVALCALVACKRDVLPVVAKAKVSADKIHVTAISLGQTRLAIINGKQLAEGDQLTVPPAKVYVVKISDGEVELGDGTQVIKAALEVTKKSAPKR